MAAYIPITNGIVLKHPAYYNPVTLRGSVTNIGTTYNGDAVYGTNVTAWTLTNYGTITSNLTSGGGVVLAAGGNVSNAAGTALISGVAYGVYIKGGAGTVGNLGTIAAGGGAGNAVLLAMGGSIGNSGVISATGYGVFLGGAVGTVVNSGTITSVNDAHWGVDLSAGGSVTNQSSGYIHGGVFVNGGTVRTVVNHGTIARPNNDGVRIAAGYVDNSGTISGTIGVNNYSGVGTIVNTGTVTGTGTASIGIELTAGGTVTNGASGSSGAFIEGAQDGVLIAGGAGTVANFGTIASTGTASTAVYLTADGSVSNAGTGLISAGADGVVIAGSAGNVVNSATIGGANLGVWLKAGGAVTNSGSIAGTGTAGDGVTFGTAAGGAGTLVNTGTITGNNLGAWLDAGGSVSNAAGTALISGYAVGVSITGSAGTVANLGTIQGTGTAGAGVNLQAGGTVNNNAASALIAGYVHGIYIGGAAGTVANLGTILGTSYAAVSIAAGLVSNDGTISALGTAHAGVAVQNASGTVVNRGVIQGSRGGSGIHLHAGGSISNGSVSVTTASITGGVNGVNVTGGSGTVDNYATIAATGTAGLGVYLAGGGTVTNTASGRIDGYKGVVANAVATVTNLGLITGIGTNGTGVDFLVAGGTLTNAGTIIGGPTGAAVRFTSGGNRLIVDPGAVFSGSVNGGGGIGDVLELAAGTAGATGTISGLGTNFVGFDNVTVDSLATWLLAGPANLGSGTTLSNSGTLDIGGTVTVGGVLLDNGVIDIATSATLAVANGASGFGSLVFAGTSETLEIDGTTMPATSVVISGFTLGDTIHLRDIAGGNAGRPVPGFNNLLTVFEGGIAFPLQFDPAQSFGGFAVVGDGVSGTDLLALPHLTVSAGRTTVSAGQAYISAAVSGGTLVVASNGGVYGTQIGSAGSETISSGGFDSGTVIVGGGRQTVLAGGVASGTVLDAAAAQNVFGSANGAVVSAGDTQRVESGGVATSTTVSSGGSEVVSAGGTAIGSLVLSGGTETVLAGGTDSGARLSGGLQDLFGTASGDTVVSGGRQLVESGGVASNTVVASGGTIELAAGGVESGAITFGGVGGDLTIDGGAAIPTVPISGFVLGDTIDLQGLAFTPAISASILSGTLSLTSGGTVVDQLAVAGISDGQPFVVTSDGVGGTAIGRGASTTVAYMTGATDPWDVGAGNTGSPDAAMDTAFGAGNWTKIQGFTAAALTAGFKFIYLDGGDGDAAEFDSFIASNRAALQNFVAQGGRLFINAARWKSGTGAIPASDINFNLGFGVTLEAGKYSGVGTALQVTNPIFTGYNGPTGSSWTGNWFSHDFIVGSNGVSLTPLISGTNGSGTAGVSLAGEHYGGGYVMFGGITSPSFQSPQPQADLLRANILDFVAGVGAVTPTSLFDFVFTYTGGTDYYIGTVAGGGTFKYTAGETINTTAGQYDIFNKESGTTAEASGTVHVIDYSHSGPGVASPIPVLTAAGQADGTAGLGSESDQVVGTDGQQHAFSSTLKPNFPMAGLFGFVFTYADGAAFYSGTVVAAPGATPALPGSSLGTYTFFAEGVTAQLAGTVVIDRFTEGPASFVPNGAGGAAGTGGLGSEAGSVTVNGTTFNFSDNLEPVIPLSVATVPVIPAPPTADIIATQLNQIYNEVLGRNPSSTELQNASAAVAGGTSLSAIRSALAGSPEAQGDLTQLYRQIFARAATGGELAADTGQLAGGSSLQTVQLTLAQSPEAQTDLQTIYSNVLGRTPNGNELATFIGQLGDEQPSAPADPNGRPGLAGVRDIVAHSPDAQAVVTNLFENFPGTLQLGVKGRPPTAAELVGMEDQLSNGATLSTLQSALSGVGSAGGYAPIAAPSGSVSLTAQAGTPTLFDFTNLAFGADTIVGFDPSRDTIELPTSLAAGFAAVQADLSQAAGGALITLNASQSILVSGVAPANLGPANFLIV